MKRFFSTTINKPAFNTGMLLLRLVSGIMMLRHGYDKFNKFNQMKGSFMNFMHLGSTVSLSLVVFAEFFCAAFVIIGLFTRFAALVLLINLSVIIFMVWKMDVFGKAEVAALYAICFIVIFICGPGRASVDSLISKS